MKRLFTLLLCCTLLVGLNEVQAQTKPSKPSASKSSKSSSSKKTTTKKKGKKPEVEKPKPFEQELPYNCGDALFAVKLNADVAYGPTSAPSGAGRVMEIMADKKNPNLFEYEHNSVWYEFTVPYNGNLEFTITPNNKDDDYNFLLYKYTDSYFSNHIIQNKVLPIAGFLALPDTGRHSNVIGMSKDGNIPFVTKNMKAVKNGFIKTIPVHKGEIYYIVVDNKTPKGGGHTIKAGIQVEAYEPILAFYDVATRKTIDVDLLILEANTDNRAIVKDPNFKSRRVKFVPKFNYTLYAKKEGYFSIYKQFTADELFMTDTIARFPMNRTERGTRFSITDIWFDNGESELLPESDTVLMGYVEMFRNHPDVTFMVKGYVPTYGVDKEYDKQMSLARAESVKKFFVDHGIKADNITCAGMTDNEIKRAAAMVLNNNTEKTSGKKAKVGSDLREVKIELIITSMNK